ncbi:MAG: hypothetical protein GEV08_12925 [Acidimicrobiia bacterium]|nr:hypothetical protein [Acidimicrobiia bacterium]
MLHTEQERARGLFAEASRRTDTPGVRTEIVEQLIRELSAQMATEATVIQPAVDEMLPGDLADRAVTERATISDSSSISQIMRLIAQQRC